MKLVRNYALIPILILAPIAFWIYLILSYSVNVPWFDDFNPFLDFIDKWITSKNALQKLELLFQPNNEHRMVWGKLLNLIHFWLFGNVNFSVLHYIAGAFTLGTCLIFWKIFQQLKLPPLYFIPIPLLLFQVQYHLIFLWAICGMQHQVVVFLLTLTCYLLATNRFTWAILVGLCCNFAMSNGVFTGVSGLSILLLSFNWKRISIWLPIGIIANLAYFYGMSSQGNEKSLSLFLNNPQLSLIGFLGSLGGIFDFIPEKNIEFRLSLPLIMGFLATAWAGVWIIGVILFWLKQFVLPKLKITPPLSYLSASAQQSLTVTHFCVGLLTFLLANSVVIGLLRPRFGLFVILVSNYKLYAAIFFIIIYLTLLITFKESIKLKTVAGLSAIIASVVYCFSLIHYLPSLIERRKYLLVNAYNQEHNAFGLGFVPESKASRSIDQLMKRLVAHGYYTYPSQKFSSYFEKMKTIDGAPPSDLKVLVKENDLSLQLTQVNQQYLSGKNDGLFVFLRKGSELRIYKMNQVPYTGRNPFIHYQNIAECSIPKTYVTKNGYQLGILRVHGKYVEGGIITRTVLRK